MTGDLLPIIDALDRAVASAKGVVADEVVDDAARVAARVRARRGYLGDTVVIALAGGTGSGKSSLLNAIAGEEVAATGGLRPTTSDPLAWIPANPEPGLVRLLDDLGINHRIGQDAYPWLAVIDLPDADSIAEAHRATVDRLVPQVDAVVWVVDPEKYRDRLLHGRYLEPLADYSSQFWFVLNQVDRLAPDQVEPVAADLAAGLRADGIGTPRVFLVAADPAVGPPLGVEDLVSALAAELDAKKTVAAKLETDLRRASSDLAAAGLDGGGVGFAARWDEVLDVVAPALVSDVVDRTTATSAARHGAATARAAVALRPRRTPPPIPLPRPTPAGGVRNAVELLGAFAADLSREVGQGEIADRIRTVDETLDSEVLGAFETVAVTGVIPAPDPPRWWKWAAWARRLILAPAVVAVVWLVSALVDRSAIMAPALTLAVCVVGLLTLHLAAGSSGTRRGADEIVGLRNDLIGRARRELDRRIGRPLREGLRTRGVASAALAELRIALERLG